MEHKLNSSRNGPSPASWALMAAALICVPLGAQAADSASSIAERFAADGKEPTTGTDPTPQAIEPDYREEAQQAVERALAQERARAANSQDEAEAVTPAPPATASKLEEDAEDLSEKLREVRRKRAVDDASSPQQPEKGLVSEVVSRFATQASEYISPLVEKRVTVMLEMEVGKTGVRRWSKTADPMLCIHENCYLSRGEEAAAEKLTRAKAFGPGVALGKRGQACRSKPACIFRDINLETVEAKLQPIDLKFLRHDRRDAQPIRADTTCAIIKGALSCRNPVEGKTWRAWIVPESVAKDAGAEGLRSAIAKGLD